MKNDILKSTQGRFYEWEVRKPGKGRYTEDDR